MICTIGYVAPRGRGPHPEGDNSGRGLPEGGRSALIERGYSPALALQVLAKLLYRSKDQYRGEPGYPRRTPRQVGGRGVRPAQKPIRPIKNDIDATSAPPLNSPNLNPNGKNHGSAPPRGPS